MKLLATVTIASLAFISSTIAVDCTSTQIADCGTATAATCTIASDDTTVVCTCKTDYAQRAGKDTTNMCYKIACPTASTTCGGTGKGSCVAGISVSGHETGYWCHCAYGYDVAHASGECEGCLSTNTGTACADCVTSGETKVEDAIVGPDGKYAAACKEMKKCASYQKPCDTFYHTCTDNSDAAKAPTCAVTKACPTTGACDSNGVCTAGETDTDNYSCACNEGHTNESKCDLCELNYTLDSSTGDCGATIDCPAVLPCGGQGTCTKGAAASGDVKAKPFTCDCNKGYTGARCETSGSGVVAFAIGLMAVMFLR